MTKNISKNPASKDFLAKSFIKSIPYHQKHGKTPADVIRSSQNISLKSHDMYSKQAPISDDIRKNPIGYLRSQPQSYQRYVNAHLQNKFTYATQTVLGAAAGVGRQRANKLHREIVLDGVLHTQHRGVQRTNCSWLNPEFKRIILKPWVRRRLQEFLPELHMDPPLEKSLLYSSISAEATQVNILNINPNISLSPTSEIKKNETKPTDCVVTAGKESNMSNEVSIPTYVTDIKSINLTEYGKMRLSCFSKETIEYADRQICSKGGLDKPFSFFAKICHNFSTQNGYPINNGITARLVGGSSYSDKDEKLINNLINKDAFPRSQGAKRPLFGKEKAQSRKHLKENEYASRFTSSSNSISEWWSETLSLRQTNHDLYIQRLQERRKAYDEKHGFVSIAGPVSPFWKLYCGTPDGLYYNELEKEDESNNGVAFQRFLESDIGQQFYKSAHPKVKSILAPLFQKMFHVEEFPALLVNSDDKQNIDNDVASRNERSDPHTVVNELSEGLTNVFQSLHNKEQLQTPYLEDESPWQEVYE